MTNDRVYSDASGRLLGASIDRGINAAGPYLVQQLNYTYDSVGNVTRRYDSTPGYVRDELFYTSAPGDGYDGLDRLKTHRIVGGATVNVAYDQKGNITSKSDVGNYSYVGYGPHAVSAAGANAYTYDANGNMLAGANRTHTWTSFNQLRKVTTGTLSSEFIFDAAHQRVKQIRKSGATTTDVTFYIGSLYEKVVAGTTTEHKHYILGPTGRIAVHTDRSTLAKDTRYFHTDGLGSITVISDEAGRVLKRYVYDAWGKQSTAYTNTGSGITNQAPSTRGFTDHEMLVDHGLVHMNGRVYDSTLARFISADPNVDGVADAQGYNRYSYVGNNPLGATDPTGFFALKDALKIAAAIVVSVVVTIVTYGALTGQTAVWFGAALGNVSTASNLVALTGGMAAGGNIAAIGAVMAGGFASGFAGSLLNGASLGDAFRSGAIGGGVALLTAGIAGVNSDSFGDQLAWKMAAHGAVGGASAELQGGSFRHGFMGSAASAFVGYSGLGRHLPGDKTIATRTIRAAVIGGTVSAIGGGKFANGAVTSAFQHLFNNETQLLKEDLGRKRLAFYDPKDKGMPAAARFYAGENAIPVRSAEDIERYFRDHHEAYDEIIFFTHSGDGEHIGFIRDDSQRLRGIPADSSVWSIVGAHVFDTGKISLATACDLAGNEIGRKYVDSISALAGRTTRSVTHVVQTTPFPMKQVDQSGKPVKWEWYYGKN